MDVIAIVVGGLVAVVVAIVVSSRRGTFGAARMGTAHAADEASELRHLRDRLAGTERELAEQLRNATSLADLTGAGIIRVDPRGVVELANGAAHTLLGRDPGALPGRTVVEVFLDRRVEQLIEGARPDGSLTVEYRPGGADGPTLHVRARRSPGAGAWVVLEDVSELRRLRQIRTEFVDNLSHELRTPLSTVSLLAETLAREAEAAGEGVPPRMRDRIGKIEVETGHLVQMVNELLDLARIEGGGPLVLVDGIDLGRVAREATERLRVFAERQGLPLTVVVAPDLPAIRGDEARLGQVVVNLVHNALKFGWPDDPAADAAAHRPPDAEAAGVRVTVRANGGDVILAVEDHGVGIPAADVGRIFERFYKVDRVRARSGGTGLGLAIARHVIEQHGGRIHVASEEGRGATFTVILPVAARDDGPLPTAVAPAASMAASPTAAGAPELPPAPTGQAVTAADPDGAH